MREEWSILVTDLLKRFNLQNKSFIDIGCGDGIQCFTAYQLGASYIVGIDNNFKQLYLCKQQFNNYSIKFQYGNLNNNINEQFDFIVINLPQPILDELLWMGINKNLNNNTILLFSYPKEATLNLEKYQIINYIEGQNYNAYALKEKA